MNVGVSYRRFGRDLCQGRRLYILQQSLVYGFRGNAKGKGFRAYLDANKIPPRQAYRLIQRYLRMRGIWDMVFVTNEALETPFPLPTTRDAGAALR